MKCPKFPCTASNIKVAVNKCNSRCKPSNTYETIRLKPNFCCKINSLTQDMLCKENAKYVIEYDFSLLGQTITVPKNCILEFDGGTLSNGTIIGQDTYINDVGGLGVDTLFGEGTIRKGTWRMNEGGGSTPITVDSELSDTSTNPVQNKVIKKALDNKQDKLTSGQNIKTINGESILGSGNIQIEGGGGNSYTKQESDAKYQIKGNYATKQQLTNKVDKVTGKSLSTNDYTNEDKKKVAAALTEHQDISGKADKTSLLAEVTRATNAEENLRQLYNNLQQSQPIPVTTLPAVGETGKIYRLAGTTSYADYMYAEGALTTPIKMAEYNNAIDNEPKKGSHNLISSDAVAVSLEKIHPKEGSVELSIQDEKGNSILDLNKGNIISKKFDSAYAPKVKDGTSDDSLSVSDESGNNIVEFSEGHIKTKEFDSKEMLAVKGLVSDIDRIQNWMLTGGAYTTQYTYSFFEGGFEVTKNVPYAPGHNRAIDLSSDILPGKLIFEYSYDGTNNIPVFDSKNAELIYWGTDVTNANIIGTIKPGTGTLEVEIVHNDRKYVGIYCNDLQVGATLRVTNTHAQVKASSSKNDPIYASVYSSKINEISDAYYNLGEAGRIGYIFITDLHFNSNINNNKALLRQLQAVVDIANNCQIDFVCVGGDVVDGTSASASKELVISYIKQMMNILSGCKCPVVILAGNHDDNCYHSSGYGDTDKGFYARNMLVDNAIIPQMIIGGSDADDCYYYFDIEKKNLRVICLDYINYNKNANKSGINWWGFSREQVTWLCNTALDTDKNVIIFSHGQIVDVRYGFWNLEDEGDKDWSGSVSNKINNSVPAPSGYVHAYYPGYTTDIKNVISAFNAKSSITLYGNTYDFSTRNGNIILSHHGHFHGDFELNIGNMPVILTGCAKNEPGTYYADYKVAGKEDTYMFPDAAAAESQHANGYGYEFVVPNNRDFGTINEALFDVVSVNSTAINILRVGVGKNRVINR